MADLKIVGVEMTQATQYFSINGQGSGYAPDNSVPLVAQRSTVLRVYIDHAQPPTHLGGPGQQSFATRISGRVVVDRIRSDGSPRRLAILDPINASIASRAAASIDRGNADHTLNFRVRAADCQGQLRFTVIAFDPSQVVSASAFVSGADAGALLAPEPGVVSRAEAVAVSAAGAGGLLAPEPGVVAGAEAGASSDSTAVYGRFEPVPTFRVHGVLVHYTGDGMDLPAPTGFDLAATLEYSLRTYPIGRIEFDACTEIELDKNLRTPGGGCGPGFEGPGGLMEILADFDDSSDQTSIHVGLIPSGAIMSVGGCGNRNIATAKVGGGTVLAQEMGHALDRKHAPTAPGADPNFPIYGNYRPGSIGEYGFDVVTSEVYDPNRSDDFMSYGSNRWVSPYTYMGIRAMMTDRFSGPLAAGNPSFREADDGPRETLFLSFRVERDGTVKTRPSFHLPSRPRLHDRAPVADVSCELLNADGAVLHFQRCRLRGSHVDPEGPYVDFRERLPWFDEVTEIRFLRNGNVLHVHPVEESAPTVELQAHELRYSAEPETLIWAGRHPDRTLTFMVRYSSDGGRTWRVVAANLRQSLCTLRQGLLPGGKQCVVQVVATSGIRTAVTQSKPFAAPVTPRSATILSADVTAPGRVVLRGGAFSPDFGLGSPDDVTWVSNVDGLIGHGLEVVADHLATERTHAITLTAPDGMGGLATATTQVTTASDQPHESRC